MAKQTLPVNFKDDILASSMGGKRRYNLIQNDDGTYSLEDVTEYTQTGSDFGSGQINATNQAVNESCDKADVIDDLEDVVANQANGMIAGAKAVATLNEDLAELNSKSIIESGQNDNGHYRKYADGTLEMWGRAGATVWITNTQGSIYYSNIIEINFPIASVSTANVNIYVESSGVVWSVGASYDNNTLAAFRMASDRSISNLNVRYSWRATGTWK